MAIKVLSTTDILGATFETGSPRLTVGAAAEVSQLNFQYSSNYSFTSYSNQLFLSTGNNGVFTVGVPTSGNTSNVVVQGYLDAKNFKINGAQGSDGQVLTSTGSGVAWESVSTSGGDITAVVAGAGLTGGSTSGSATLNLDIDGTNNYIEMNNAYTPASGDFIPFSDIADATGNGDNNVVRKTTFSNFPETTMPSIKITDIAGTSPSSTGNSQVYVPLVNTTTGVIDSWTFINRAYSGTLTVTGSSGLTGSGTFGANQSSNTTITLSHSDTSSQSSVNNSSGTVIQDVTLDTYGHVTSLGSVNLDNRYVVKAGGTFEGDITVEGVLQADDGFSSDGNNSFHSWRALQNTASSTNQYFRIARISGGQSSRFIIELAGRSSSYSDGTLPAFGKIVGQLNNDNNYDIVYYNASATDEVVDEVGQVDVSTSATDIYVRVGTFSELTATAHISDGSISPYDTNNGSTSAPTGYVQATEYKLWNTGNDGSGSGLDADLLDGQQNTQFLRKLSGGSEANIDTYTDNGIRSLSYTGHSRHLMSFNLGGSPGTTQQEWHYNGQYRFRNKVDNNNWSSWRYVVSTTTNQDELSGTIWHSGNDGSGSGLDADTLDGQHASAFLTAHPNISAASSSNNSGNTFIQDITLDSNGHVTGLATGSASGFLTSESDTLATVTGRGATTTTSCTFNTITMNTPVVGTSNKIKFGNNDFIRFDDANGVGRFHFDCDGATNNASLQAATFVGALSTTGISGSNYNISGVNQLSINDPGEGIVFGGGSSGNITLAVVDDSSDNILRLTGTGATLQVGTNRVLTTADEGSGNGLDADTLDGNHASAFLTAHPNISAASSSNNSGRTYIQDITLDSNGHVTGIGTATETVTNTDTNNYLSSASFNTGNGVITFNRSGLSAVTVDIDNRYAYYDHIRSLGTPAFTNGSNPNITTAQLISEIESDGGFDSRTSVFKTSWSYAGNYNLTDAGRFTETAGTSWITWTDNSSDTTRGNITAMAICPTTGGSANKVFIYNDQGSSYSPGWREVWTSASDGAGSGLDADLLDGQHGSHYLDYNNFTNVPATLASSSSGNRWGVNGFIGTDGVMEVGRYIDFHTSDGSTSDYAHRLTVTGSTLYHSAGISGTSAAFSSTCDFNSHVDFAFSSGSKGTRIETASTAIQTLRCDSDRFRFYMGGGSGEVFTIEQSGKIGIKDSTPDYPLDVNHNVSNTSIYASHDIVAYSDIRVKKDIETIPDALDKVNKLRGVTYKRTDEGSTDRTMMGVIAQEVEEVIPEVVSTKESDGHKAVAYGNMVGVLIEAVKELTEKVRILEEKLKDK